MFNHLDDTYLNLFDQNEIVVEIDRSLDIEKIYFIILGADIRVYFPNGAQNIEMGKTTKFKPQILIYAKMIGSLI